MSKWRPFEPSREAMNKARAFVCETCPQTMSLDDGGCDETPSICDACWCQMVFKERNDVLREIEVFL